MCCQIKLASYFVAIVSTMAISATALAYQNKAKLAHFGFSQDGKSLVMAQTLQNNGIGGENASIMVIDVAKNSCLKGGCLNIPAATNDDEPRPDGDTLKEALSKTWNLRKSLGLTPPVPGILLPETSRQETNSQTMNASFRDELNNRTIGVEVRQAYIPGSSASGEYVPDRASLEVNISDGHFLSVVDNINNFRKYVLKYSLKDVRLSPNGRGLALMFEKISVGFEGTDHTYFVETVDFPALNSL